ncbi:repeat-containing DDB_G0287407-like [Argonauta hians]
MACSRSRADNCEQGARVKLFVTSYAEDFFSERELLRKEIQPELETWANINNIKLEVYHIKWGGKHTERRDTTELKNTQSHIETCYYNNVMPVFLNFTSDSIGWVPSWGDYPPHYIDTYLTTYGLTSLDMELMYGAYREDNLNSLFLYRSDSFLECLPAEERCVFPQKMVKSHGIVSDSYNKINQRFPPERVMKYKPVYKGLSGKRKRPKLQFNDGFKEMICDFVKMRVLHDYLGHPSHRGLYHDHMARQLHESFMLKKSERIKGRHKIINQIEEYIVQEKRDVPLILVGGAGSGKSSVLCKAAALISKKASEDLKSASGKSWHIFYHFVGAVPGSTTVEVMLKRLLREMDRINDSNMPPKDLDGTAQVCCSMLSNPNTRPLIMFVDALNQFVDDQAARVLSWLPRKLAPQVRIIFSSIEDSQQHLTLVSRETKPIEIHITPLDVESRKDMARDLLKVDPRSEVCVSEEQLDALLSKESSENPLWLAVACQVLKHCDNHQITDHIHNLPSGLLNLLAEVLTKLEGGPQSQLITATLCLLEASSVGLLESELRQILGNEANLMPPSPFDEKEEKESSEKESVKKLQCLPEEKWQQVYSTLKPFLRPYGDSNEGRIDFYHRAVSKAVRKIYFEPGENEVEKSPAYYWWHKKLADFFQTTPNTDRMIEEYPYQLVCLNDTYRLSQCLCDWRIFDVLYHEEYSSALLSLWRKVGNSSAMVSAYEKALSEFEEEENIMEELVSIRYEKVCRVVIQAGKNHEALELLKTAIKIEEKELGARNHRMVELYALMAEIYDEKLKLNDFVSPSQLPDLRKAISYSKKAIALRKKLTGRYHKFKLGMSLMKIAFNMESWEACGGSEEMPGSEALAEGNRCIDVAIKIFQELNDIGHYAEALMTKGVLATQGSMEQLKLYNQAMDLCMQMYGEYHILTSRLYINIGIVYEDNKEYRKAYEYFKKWARVSEEILGPDHPKTRRAKGVLQETRYRRLAQELGEWDYEGQAGRGRALGCDSGDDDDDDEDDEMENPDLEHYYDDAISQQTEQDRHRHQYRVAAAQAARAAAAAGVGVGGGAEMEAMGDNVDDVLDNRARHDDDDDDCYADHHHHHYHNDHHHLPHLHSHHHHHQQQQHPVDVGFGGNDDDDDDDDDDSCNENFEFVTGRQRPQEPCTTTTTTTPTTTTTTTTTDRHNRRGLALTSGSGGGGDPATFDLDEADLSLSDREHSDNENFFDDNCEDYDEQYTLLVDHFPAIGEGHTRPDCNSSAGGGGGGSSGGGGGVVVTPEALVSEYIDDDTNTAALTDSIAELSDSYITSTATTSHSYI